ncbi:MAG: S8 family serine peptidase, partial [Thermoplasmata archaeon]|nr:S8 family serine peptidase [Thermoplasmata archaeon]
MEESKTKRVGQVFAIAIALAFVIPTMITFVGMATEQSDLPILESNNAPDTRLFLRHGDFDTNRGEPYARANYQAGYGADEEVFYIVQFNDKVTDEMKDSVRGVGAKVLETEYIHENAYVVKMTGNMKGNIEKLSSVQWCGLLQPDYKISDKSDDWAGEYYWCVWVFKGEDVRDVAAELKTIGAREVMIEAESLTNPEKRNNPYIYCYIDMAIMPEVLTIPEIAFINDRSPVPLTRSKQSSELLNAADAWDTARSGLDVPLTGYDPVTGYQGLGITDSGLDASHLDFTTGPTGVTRVFNGGTDSDGHGTGCAGAAAGNGWNWLSVHGEVLPGAGSAVEYDRGNAGTAPEAMVNMYSTTPDPELSHDDQYFDGPIFRVFSSSSGYDPADGTYESQCAGIDAFIFDTGWDSIGCYAAANSGDAPQYPGDTPGPYGVLDPLKNGLCVAASNNDAPQNGTHTYTGYGIVEWSSRGPSDDGRIKPDIAAPGTFVHSTRSDDESDSIPYGPNE